MAADIPAEEEMLLARVLRSLADHAPASPRPVASGRGSAAANGPGVKPRARYDEELVALRDEIGEARLEDVPQLVAQMERLQQVSLRRADLQTILVDPTSPYFGHLRLREQVRGRGHVERDVLIGRATFVDPGNRINIVDWRHAPISQLFYRYGEGSDYEERFNDRDLEGEILVRRTLTIEGGVLVRIASPQGIWTRRPGANTDEPAGVAAPWDRHEVATYELAGGEQTSTSPARERRARGVLGAAPLGVQALNRHLPEIAALIDSRQFDLVTARDAGVVVIQGGAGSGKTTVGLHRLAYLAFTYPNRFPPARMVVVTYGAALAAYIGEVLPSLGIQGVRVLVFASWAEKELRAAIPWLRAEVVDEALPSVRRVKSHPALLHELERRAAAHTGKRNSRAVVELWADLLTDRAGLMALLRDAPEMPVSESDIVEAHRVMVDRVVAVMARDPRERARESRTAGKTIVRRPAQPEENDVAVALGERRPSQRTVDSDLPEGVRRVEGALGDDEDDQNIRGDTGIDGLRTEDDRALLDLDDVAILLHGHQLLCGVKQTFAHLFVDEAQDLSPMRLSVLIGRTGRAGRPSPASPKAASPSITLAGDTSQKLFLDNGFGDWRGVLGHLGLVHVAVEPLRLAYRSTREILTVARQAMGPLADDVVPEAPRRGAPVEGFRFSSVGAAVAFLAEALRDLPSREPRATVALLARHPEQADRYYDGLRRAEVPSLRRVRAQEFAFRPGVEVTDVRQVKGLEFDYVVMLDANDSTYGQDDESRHLFHIGVTRAAHQLWLIVTGTPSRLFPPGLLHE